MRCPSPRTLCARSLLLAIAFASALAAPALHAADDRNLTAPELQSLADKLQRASMRDQCYLLAKLIHGTTELADRQLAAGENSAGATSLETVQTYTGRLDAALAADAKKLKDAEVLLRESSFRLHAAMLASSLDDRPAMAAALAKINAAEAKIMGIVFAK